MENNKTDRGFTSITFEDSYGESCSIQQSSSADEPKIWLGIDNPKLVVFENESRGAYQKIDMPRQFMVSTSMHLTVDQVKELLPHLIRFSETGEL